MDLCATLTASDEPSLWRVPPGGPTSKLGSRNNLPPIQGVPRVYHLYKLADALRSAGMDMVQPVVHASAPIVKFRDPVTGKNCDLNVNDLGGWCVLRC